MTPRGQDPPKGLQVQRDESNDGRRSFGSCCPEDLSVWCRLLRESDQRTRGPQSPVLSDTTVILTPVKGGALQPQSGFADGVGVDGAAVGPQGLLPGRFLQRFMEQIIDEDGVVLAVVDVCDLQRLVLAVPLLERGGAPALVHRQSGSGVITVEIPQVQFLEKVVDVPVVCHVR